MKVVDIISVAEPTSMADKMYGNLIKAVVDLQKQSLVVGAEMLAGEEHLLLDAGSTQQDLWGINLYSEKFGTHKFAEFDPMISIRPRQKNMSRDVEDSETKEPILALVAQNAIG